MTPEERQTAGEKQKEIKHFLKEAGEILYGNTIQTSDGKHAQLHGAVHHRYGAVWHLRISDQSEQQSFAKT
jgi:hypothetical protein